VPSNAHVKKLITPFEYKNINIKSRAVNFLKIKLLCFPMQSYSFWVP